MTTIARAFDALFSLGVNHQQTPGDCHCPCCAQYACARCNTYCVDDHGYTCWSNCGLGC